MRSVSETKNVSRPIRTGVVGLGRAGWKIHAAPLGAMPARFEIAGVCDPDASRCAEASAQLLCPAHQDLDGILRDPDIELVVVASPSHLHTEQSLAAIAEGKHVVCEKPFALSAEDADRTIEAAEAAGVVVAPFQNRRYEPHFRKVLELVRSGELGEVLQIRICWHRFSRRWDWQAMRRFGGGVLFNNGAHLIDQALDLVDDPEPELFLTCVGACRWATRRST